MKYEEIEVGDKLTWKGEVHNVIAKIDGYKGMTTIDEEENIIGWREDELEDFQPITPKLPETGLLDQITSIAMSNYVIEQTPTGVIVLTPLK